MMSNRIFTVSRVAPIALALLVAACGSGDRPRSASSAPRQTTPARTAAATPALNGRTSASVWQLRAGLNVAALSCRGRGKASVSGDYRRMLSRHKALLAAAYKAEERRLGRAGFDRQQTRMYNRYANQRSPQQFCQTASQVARNANRMNSAEQAPAARGMVAQLDRRLR